MSLHDPEDVLSGWVPARDPGPAPDLSQLDGGDPLVAEWLLSDHPWAEPERTRRRERELQELIERSPSAPVPPWVLEAQVDAAEPDQAYLKRARRSLESRRQLDDRMYVYPPGLMGPMASLWAPPGHPPHVPGLEPAGWNLDTP
ncbi:hypothetical protein ACODT4_44280 [Streptomyces sp. 2.9]|uniref:hypothetical protein n=1 Tax=Streptomyces tritrimontium TaxID=3406573 RepID=UPI003BB6CC18